MIKCIKDTCPYYFESDIREYCSLADEVITDKCIGLKKVPERKETLICQMSTLQTELDRLMGIERFVKINQSEALDT